MGIYAPSEDERKLEADAKELRRRWNALRHGKERAQHRARDIDRLLTASGEANRWKAEIRGIQRRIEEAESRRDRLGRIEKDLGGEIADIEQQQAKRRTDDAVASLESRLNGAADSGRVTSDVDLDADLSSRRATLEAALAAKQDLEIKRKSLAEDKERARKRYMEARGRAAELNLLEALENVLPIVAELRACRAWVDCDLFRMVDDEAVRIASAAIEADLADTDLPTEQGSPTASNNVAPLRRHHAIASPA
jgi:chromosome segregation ATPase